MAKTLRSMLVAACLLLIGCSSPENVEVSVDAPTAVAQGERFEIRARVLNTATKTQTLVDLDIADKYLDGIVIESTEPRFSEAIHIPIRNVMSYSFDLPIEPGEELVVVLRAYAARPGDYAGTFDFCINSETSFISYPARTIVE